MSDILEVKAELKEITPIVQVPITIKNPKVLTYEERQEAYAVLRQYSDYHLLPLPEEFWDNDPFSERGLTQLEHDAHIVGLLNVGMMTLSTEKEQTYRTRLAHKIELIRESKGLGRLTGIVEGAESIDGVSLERCSESRVNNAICDESALE